MIGDRSGAALRAGEDGRGQAGGRREQWRSQDRSDSPAPAAELQVVDPVGAGDSFDAGFLTSFCGGGVSRHASSMGIFAALFRHRSGGTEAFRDLNAMREFFGKHGVSV